MALVRIITQQEEILSWMKNDRGISKTNLQKNFKAAFLPEAFSIHFYTLICNIGPGISQTSCNPQNISVIQLGLKFEANSFVKHEKQRENTQKHNLTGQPYL